MIARHTLAVLRRASNCWSRLMPPTETISPCRSMPTCAGSKARKAS